ncbi:MAG: hypothetical protein ABH884_04170 [Candidatus Komeilibacteria bacterium]
MKDDQEDKIEAYQEKPITVVAKPVLTRYERLYHQRLHVLWLDIAIVSGILALFVVAIIFWNHPITSNRHIDLAMTNDQLISGAVNEFTIQWTNENRDTIKDAYLSLWVPTTMSELSLKGDQYKLENNLIMLGDILPGTEAAVTLSGLTWADLDQGLDWEIRLYYKNLGIRHNKTLKTNFACQQSVLQTDISMPNSIYQANRFDLHIEVINTAELGIDDVMIVMQPPGGLSIVSQTLFSSDYSWQINHLNPDTKYDLQLSAIVDYVADPYLIIGTTVSVQIGELRLLQNRQSSTSEFIRPQVDLDLSLDNSKSFYLDQYYRVRVFVFNREQYDLRSAQIKLISKAENLEIIIKPQQIDYDNIKSSAEKFVDFEFMLKKIGVIANSASLQAELIWFDQESNQIYLYSTPITITLNPQLIVDVGLYYYTPDGDQIGYGPLPPEVDEATSYWLSIKLWPTFGSLDSLKLEAQLGNGVSLKNYNTIAGEIIVGDKIVWQIDQYNDDVYQSIPRLNLQLEVTPQDDQIGQVITLLSNVSASAISKVTGVVLEQNRANITNSMESDSFRPNNGRVVY